MSRVAIVGAGELGSAAAQALAAREAVRRVMLVDASASAATGKALDIQQSGAVTGFGTRLDATDDVSAITGVDVCVIANPIQGPEPSVEDGLRVLAQVVPYLSGAPIVFAGTQQAELMLHAARELRVAGSRLIGSAAEAFASAVRAIVALEARCSPNEIAVAVLGSPPFVVSWSEASIGGYAIARVLSQVQLARAEARAARLWPPGPYTLGAAAATTVEAIVTSARQRVSVLTLLGGEFGARDRIGALPVLLNRLGIADARVPALNTRERVLVETSLGI